MLLFVIVELYNLDFSWTQLAKHLHNIINSRTKIIILPSENLCHLNLIYIP